MPSQNYFMKRLSVLVLVGGSLLLASGCGTPKTAQTVQTSSPVPREDTTTVEFPENGIVVTPEAYHPSFTIINDLVNTKLNVKFDWQKQYLYGKEWVTLKPHFYSTDSLTLDAKGMDLNKVELVKPSGNVPLTYTYDSLRIHIRLDKTYKRDEQYTIYIDYTSKPNEKKINEDAPLTEAKGLYFINADEKDTIEPRQLWTQGETESNSSWFPTIDKPIMKTTLELTMTVEDGFVSLSNGLMTSSKKNGDGTHTDTWKLDQPIAPYLIMMAAGPFAVVKDHWKNIEVNYYVDKDYEKYARAIFGHTPEMIQHFSDLTGVPYPWPKFSQVIVHEFTEGAMENVSAVVHNDDVQRTARQMIDEDREDYISHELFHQWFGDLVTCESWSNIALNESFADYGEYLWNEYKYGRDEADYRSNHSMNYYLGQPEEAAIPLVRYNYHDEQEIFDVAIIYYKGGLILNMLRNYVGDDAFFKSLHEYLTAHQYGTVEAQDLRLAFEKVTGQDLNWFFNQWFFAPGHPKLNISYEYNPDQHNVAVTVEQTQETGNGVSIFKIPVAVDVYVNGKVNRYKATFDQKEQTRVFPCDGKPDLVNFDGDKMLLCTKSITQSDTAYAFQFNHAPLFLDRYEAVSYFRKKNPSSPFYNEIISKALSDPFWDIRLAGIAGVNSSGSDAMKNKVLQLASDKNSHVRAGALKQIATWKDPATLTVAGQALNDSSYLVMATALDVLNKLDSVKAYAAAQKLEKEKSEDLADAIYSIYGSQAGPEKSDFMLNKLKEAGDFEKYQMLQNYSVYLSRNVLQEEMLQKALPVLYDLAENSSYWWLRVQSMNTLVAVEDALQDEINKFSSRQSADPNELISLKEQLDDLKERVHEIQLKEPDERLRSMYDVK